MGCCSRSLRRPRGRRARKLGANGFAAEGFAAEGFAAEAIERRRAERGHQRVAVGGDAQHLVARELVECLGVDGAEGASRGHGRPVAAGLGAASARPMSPRMAARMAGRDLAGDVLPVGAFLRAGRFAGWVVIVWAMAPPPIF